ncbi:squalene synthase HpnC [Methylophaga sp. 41_12_T18]|nr:squalene synthase HpnC [Methylophaga sp. 41_12_T18]
MKTDNLQLQQAYDYCQQLANSHYENFPVASVLLPKRLRRPISVIYAFSRTADDFADEGDASAETRLHQLDDYSLALRQISDQDYQGDAPIFIALADVIQTYDLPVHLFDDLLSAFKQDVVKNRYANFNEVLDYCTRSANPVGRLLLHLEGSPSQKQLEQSDAVCTALQLINFYQDIEQDFTESNRVYIPQDELTAAGLSDKDLISPDSQQIAPLIRSLYQRTQLIMSQGYLLGTFMSGRLGWEIRAMTLGGISTLQLLTTQSNESLLQRPRLTKFTKLKILFKSGCRQHYINTADKLLN